MCPTSTPEWCRTSHNGIEPSSLTYAFVKSITYARKRVKADSFKHATGRLGLMFVTLMSKTMIQHMKNSVFCRCLRNVYKSSMVRTRLVAFESELVDVYVSSWCVSIIGGE